MPNRLHCLTPGVRMHTSSSNIWTIYSLMSACGVKRGLELQMQNSRDPPREFSKAATDTLWMSGSSPMRYLRMSVTLPPLAASEAAAAAARRLARELRMAHWVLLPLYHTQPFKDRLRESCSRENATFPGEVRQRFDHACFHS